MELIGTADGGVVLEKGNQGPEPEGKPLPSGSPLSNLDSSAWPGGVSAAKPQTGWWLKIEKQFPEGVKQLQEGFGACWSSRNNLNHHPGASRHPSWPGRAISPPLKRLQICCGILLLSSSPINTERRSKCEYEIWF